MDQNVTRAKLEQFHDESNDDEFIEDNKSTETTVLLLGETRKEHKRPITETATSINYRHAQIPLKYGQWSCRQLLLRRKLLLLLGLTVLIIYVNALIHSDDDDVDSVDMSEYVTVLNHSHVLGMKAASVVTSVTATEAAAAATAPHTTMMNTISEHDNIDNNTTLPSKGYLVWSDQCKIVDLDPYKREVMRYFKRNKYKPCSTRKPLSTVHYNETSQCYVLTIDKPAFKSYAMGDSLRCCYMNIERVNEAKINLTECQNFSSNVQLPNTTDSIIVKCYSNKKQIYVNGHAMIPERWKVRERLTKSALDDKQAGKQPLSVLMIGIDSISRVNLIRAMPKTAQYLYDNAWFELAGYNKVEDNTFPNIMALATGYNLTSAMHKCSPYTDGGLEKCDFIWKQFGQHGYVTAYGEDAVTINTFNYLKKGFQHPPVDYYMRPFLTAAESELSMSTSSGLPNCMGFKHEAEYVYDYALEFVRRFRNDSFFGFFWTNTHSHSDISQTTSMDSYMRQYLQQLVKQGTMDNSVVVFFSDHGLRFGPTRATWSGHMEERLPFIFIWLPTHIRQAHPEFVNALSLNRNRLTNPYDLHMTLKHILALSDRVPSALSLGPAPDCPQCQSLLQPVSPARSCADIGIEDHWCTCKMYDKVYKDSKTVHSMAKQVVQHINNYVVEFRNGSFAKLCQTLSFQSVQTAYRARPNVGDAEHVYAYRLTFYTKPNKALYEATVLHHEITDMMTLTGSVSRLNTYSGESDCIGDFAIKKYCFCRRKGG